MKFRKTILIVILIFLCSISGKTVENSSDKLDFQLSYQLWQYENPAFPLQKKSSVDHNVLKVSIRFKSIPDPKTIHYLESLGIKFDYLNNKILHIGRIYEAFVPVDKLRILANNAQILNIESADKSNHISTMNVSNDETQARITWDYFNEQGLPLTGKGITIAINDEPADIFHPAFWRADGDTFKWFDQNGNKKFDSGLDGVDLNFNNTIETNEYLAFIKAHIRSAGQGLVI